VRTNQFIREVVVGALLALVVGTVFLPVSASAGWADNNCSFSGNGNDVSIYKRSQAIAYADVAWKEGYHWGGGCWNDSDTDNQAGDPVQTESTHGEGGDCSGFTFKTWALKCSDPANCLYGENGKSTWSAIRYIHGPYTASSFKNPPGSPIADEPKSTALQMDAFASDTHIGMIYTANTSQGHDRIIEAKCEGCGTTKSIQPYRGQSAYEGAERTGWTPECHPNCV
jgi:hypothetical protein